MDGFDFGQLFLKFRYPILFILLGTILAGFGIFIIKGGLEPSTKIEVLKGLTLNQEGGEITAEINGAVIAPGVFKLQAGARVEDLLVAAGGFSANADRIWTDKFLNRAARISDGQKIFIPGVDQQSSVLSAKNSGGYQTISPQFSSDSTSLININTAGLDELDTLPGIGQVYGQNIIEHRPYSTIEELTSKGVLRQSVFNKIKDRITIY